MYFLYSLNVDTIPANKSATFLQVIPRGRNVDHVMQPYVTLFNVTGTL
jgi:hypothetical protein